MGLDTGCLPDPWLGSIGIVTVSWNIQLRGYEMMSIIIQIRNMANFLCRKNLSFRDAYLVIKPVIQNTNLCYKDI